MAYPAVEQDRQYPCGGIYLNLIYTSLAAARGHMTGCSSMASAPEMILEIRFKILHMISNINRSLGAVVA